MATAGPLDAQPYLPGTQHHPCWLRRVFSLSWPSRSAKFNNHQLQWQQRLWNFGGGWGVWPFDACFLFSMNICCALKRWIRCSHKERRAALSSSPTKLLAPHTQKGQFCKVWSQLKDLFLVPTRRRDYWFCNLADSSEASPVVTRQAFAHVWQTSKVTEDGRSDQTGKDIGD